MPTVMDGDDVRRALHRIAHEITERNRGLDDVDLHLHLEAHLQLAFGGARSGAGGDELDGRVGLRSCLHQLQGLLPQHALQGPRSGEESVQGEGPDRRDWSVRRQRCCKPGPARDALCKYN